MEHTPQEPHIVTKDIRQDRWARAFEFYCAVVTRRPCMVIIIYSALIVLLMALLFKPAEFTKDLKSLANADGPAQLRIAALKESRQHVQRGPSLDALAGAAAALPVGSPAAVEIAKEVSFATGSFDADCNDEPFGPHKDKFPKGCAGAVWSSGDPAQRYCSGDGRWFNNSWWRACCSWSGGQCVKKSRRLSWVSASELSFIYVANNGDMLAKEALSEVKDFETKLRDLSGWKDLCHTTVEEAFQYLCDPGISIISYLWPTVSLEENVTQHHYDYLFDGRGQNQLALSEVMAFLHGGFEGHDIHQFFPEASVKGLLNGIPPSSLKTTYRFRTSGKLFVGGGLDQAKEEFARLCHNDVFQFWLQAQGKYKHIRIYSNTDCLKFSLIEHDSFNDILKVLVSLFLVCLYMVFVTGSVRISISSLVIILASVPFAFVVSRLEEFNLAYAFSFFLMLGIGCDVVFVFNDHFNHSSVLSCDLPKRLMYTIAHSGKACFATCLTTSISLFANLASAYRLLREFGLFMGLCVMSSYFLLLFLLPPIIVLSQTGCCRRKSQVPCQQAELGQPSRPLSRLIAPCLRCPRSIVATFVVSMGVFLVGTAMTVEVDQGEPSLFLDEHNIPTAEKLSVAFASDTNSVSVRDNSIMRVSACALQNLAAASCSFRLCDSSQGRGDSDYEKLDNSLGSCWWLPSSTLCGGFRVQQEENSSQCSQVVLRTRLVARSEPSTEWTQTMLAALQTATNLSNINTSASQVRKLQSLVIMEEWESGHTDIHNFYDMGSMTAATADACVQPSTICEMNALCFEGPQRCKLPDEWRLMDTYSSTWTPTRRLINQMDVPNEVTNHTQVSRTNTTTEATIQHEGQNCWGQCGSTGGYCAWCGTGVCCHASGSHVADPAECNGVTHNFGDFHACIEKATVQHEGENCWGQCGSKGGNCPWCGTGVCCHSSGKHAADPAECNGATHNFGNFHACVEKVSRTSTTTETTFLAEIELPSNIDAVMPTRSFVAPNKKKVHVQIVWGLRPPTSTPLIGVLKETWSFDPSFEPENPWAQRFIHSMCAVSQFPDNLGVFRTHCEWLEDFRKWSQLQHSRFPSRRFHSDIIAFSATAGKPLHLFQGHNAKLWLVDDKVRALQLDVDGSIDSNAKSEDHVGYMRSWDHFLQEWGDDASVTVNRPFAVASSWPDAEMQIAVMSSTISTIAIALGSAFLATLAFTCDPMAGIFVFFVVAWSVCGLAFSMFALLGYAVGPIEVLGLIFFIGYAVTYSLHIAHAFTETKVASLRVQKNAVACFPEPDVELPTPDAIFLEDTQSENSTSVSEPSVGSACHHMLPSEIRVARVCVAVDKVGKATLSSAMSTIVSTAICFACTLIVFIKLATILATVTAFSIVGALLVMPAMLALAGSSKDPWWHRVLRSLDRKSRYRVETESSMGVVIEEPMDGEEDIEKDREEPTEIKQKTPLGSCDAWVPGHPRDEEKHVFDGILDSSTAPSEAPSDFTSRVQMG